MSLRIFCIHYGDMSSQLGDLRQIIELSRALKKRGHEILLCSPHICDYPKKEPFTIKYIPIINITLLRPLSYHFNSFFFIFKYLLEFKPDVILFYEVNFTCIPLFIAKILRLPFVLFVNGLGNEELALTNAPSLILKLLNFFQAINVRFSNRIITVTSVLKNYLSQRYKINPKKIDLIQNAVDAEVFHPMDKQVAQKKIGLKTGNYYVGFVGGLFLWRGLDVWLKSLPRILEVYANTKYVLVGTGKEKPELIRLVNDLGLSAKIIFIDRIKFEQAPFYISAFDICTIFFKPVRLDCGNPIKLYEYLACGRAVLASNVLGYGDFVEGLGAGISVDSRNSTSIAEATIRLLNDENLRYQMGKQGRMAILQGHTWDIRAKTLEDCFKAVFL